MKLIHTLKVLKGTYETLIDKHQHMHFFTFKTILV